MYGKPPGYTSDADGLLKLMADMHAGMGECSNTVEDLLGDGDRVVARFTTRFVHVGDVFGVPGTGRRLTTTGMELYRLSDGRIAEMWGEYNLSALFEQPAAS